MPENERLPLLPGGRDTENVPLHHMLTNVNNPQSDITHSIVCICLPVCECAIHSISCIV